MAERELYDRSLGEIEGLDLVTIVWSDEDDADYKISGLLITDQVALTILAGKVEVCLVECLTNGEYEMVQCIAPLFYVGEDTASHPEVFKGIKNLSLFEFCRKYQRFYLLFDDAGIEKGGQGECKTSGFNFQRES